MAERTAARILASKVMRTTAYPRPAPSLFYFAGLSPTQPWHDSDKFSFVRDFELNLPEIQKEYRALKKAYGDNDDYLVKDGEHTLNKGKWHWMNFVEKGELVN